jgi:heptaprenylglyceryl phosphate synthase
MDASAYINKKNKTTAEQCKDILVAVMPLLEECENWENDTLFGLLKEYAASSGVKAAAVMWAVRVAIARQAVTDVVSHAVAGQLLGKQLIYIEAGSGAKTPVSIDTVRAIRQAIDVPLIVGGGITTEQQMLLVFSAGANIVVVGNHFEQHPEDLPRFLQAKQSYVHTN